MKRQIPSKKFAAKIIPLALAGLLLSTQPAAAILQKGEAAPPIKLVTTSGQPITLNNYKGYVLVMDFFATWCIPCKESIPHMNALRQKYGKQGLQVLGVSVDEGSDREVRSFIGEKRISYPVAIAGEEMQTDYGLRSIPTVYVINKRGVVAEKFQGFSDQTAKAMEDTIKRLLAE
ncbi:thioredoxin-related protein disulfide reductase, putative [Citrifermentans bemidjiense Bem]|uniref:Thioredoxin-related protein disulfide reductase, putative n=1 Tax=Citrifermentans bemidjiense (strain ATCC BAA-1014 / DSM 16622 / JCM 12645 / Bem) TaxID=404380 RepID=B5EAX3_CITBB|nr:TlpA disulfide reductase family protein [Citrifermentans bemidjiense]ACH37432.1 thioredoxin-related protein disulfide reductase, putative [Citrifermentans bemidjiense Bem]